VIVEVAMPPEDEDRKQRDGQRGESASSELLFFGDFVLVVREAVAEIGEQLPQGYLRIPFPVGRLLINEAVRLVCE
jgi:hypothetical protein